MDSRGRPPRLSQLLNYVKELCHYIILYASCHCGSVHRPPVCTVTAIVPHTTWFETRPFLYTHIAWYLTTAKRYYVVWLWSCTQPRHKNLWGVAVAWPAVVACYSCLWRPWWLSVLSIMPDPVLVVVVVQLQIWVCFNLFKFCLVF